MLASEVRLSGLAYYSGCTSVRAWLAFYFDYPEHNPPSYKSSIRYLSPVFRVPFLALQFVSSSCGNGKWMR
jgi:hypothetical protein